MFYLFDRPGRNFESVPMHTTQRPLEGAPLGPGEAKPTCLTGLLNWPTGGYSQAASSSQSG